MSLGFPHRYGETAKQWSDRRRGVGNTTDRRRRRAFLLAKFGDGKSCPCHWCGAPLDEAALTVDRFPVAGVDGGTYRRTNIVPACRTCNERCAGRACELPALDFGEAA